MVLLKSEIVINAKKSCKIDRKIFGHFIENMARCIYGGLLENQRPGWVGGPWKIREGIIPAIKEMKPPVIRWPGGLYADGYNWRDGIGPKEARPLRRNRYWSRYGTFTRVLDPNWFGTHEYMEFIEEVDAIPYINVNFGTGSALEASYWVEYMNGDAKTLEGGRRLENGREKPWGVELWGIGNEMYGFWALGHSSAREYALRYSEFTRAMLEKDRNIKFVAVGCDHYFNKRWNKEFLESAPDQVNYLSIHIYLPGPERALEVMASRIFSGDGGVYRAIVAAPHEIERRLKDCAHDIKEVRGDDGIRIALDEWNLWWLPQQLIAPRWSLRDALFVSGVFNALMRCAEFVGMANIAQMINVLGVIGAAGKRFYRTAIYYPFVIYSNLAGEYRCETEVECANFSSPRLGGIPSMDEVPVLDCQATLSEDGENMTVFVINRDPSDDIDVEIKLEDFEPKGDTEIHCLNGPSTNAMNFFGRDETVSIKKDVKDCGDVLPSYNFPAHSVTALVLKGESRIS